MSKGLCTTFKVMGFVCGGLLVIFGIYLLITMVSSITGVYSSFSYDPSISYDSGISTAITMYVFLGLIVIAEGFVVFALLFSVGSAGDYMRLKRQKEGLWGMPGYVYPNPFSSYEPAPIPQPEPSQESAPPERAPDDGDAGA